MSAPTNFEPFSAWIEEDGRALRLQGRAGISLLVEAATLWQQCPSALRRRQRLEDRVPPAPAGLRIARIAAIGNYGLNIAFSDAHDRGVYPWALLETLADAPKVTDFLIPAGEAGISLHTAN